MAQRLATTRQFAGPRKLDWFTGLNAWPLLQFVLAPQAQGPVLRLVVRHAQLEHGTLEERRIAVVVFRGCRRTAAVVVHRIKRDEGSCLRERDVLLNQSVQRVGVLRKQTELTDTVRSVNDHKKTTFNETSTTAWNTTPDDWQQC